MALSSKIAKKLMGLSAAEKKALQEELDAPAKKGRTLEQTEAEYTPAERKQLEDALKKIGRDSTKMAYGGMAKKKMAKGGMPMGPDGKPTFVGDGKGKMAYGGMVKKKMAKGGMAKCGASNPASGGSRNK